MGRHKTKRFAFPTSAQAHKDKEVLSKTLKEYREELGQIKQVLVHKKVMRKRGKIQPDVDKCKLPEVGQLVGGLRHDRKRLRTKELDPVLFSEDSD